MNTRPLVLALLVAILAAAAWRWGPRLLKRATPPPAKTAEAAFCKEHGVPEAECQVCNPPADHSHTRIRLKSPEIARTAGLEVTEARSRNLEETVVANARVSFDERRTARLAPRIPGVIREILKDLGQDAEAGEVLLLVDAVELAEVQSEYLAALGAEETARRDASREKGLLEKAATSERERLAAETCHREALSRLSRSGERLRTLGMTEEALAGLREKRTVSSILALRSPFKGTVVERTGTVGEIADPARSVLTVTDLSRVWVLLDLFEAQIGRVKVGQRAAFTADAYPGEVFEGTLTWIGAQVDPDSRTLPARMEVANPGGRLKANLFGKARITVQEIPQALVVPKEAVQWEGSSHVVFVPQDGRTYQTRKVELGLAGDGVYEIRAGLVAGEKVVTTGSFLMKTEILKTSIGAG